MKKNLPTGFLALIGVSAVIYFIQPNLTAEQTKKEPVNQDISGNLKIALAKPENKITDIVNSKQNLNKSGNQAWRAINPQQMPKTFPDNLSVEYIKVADENALKISEGHKISFLIPQEDKAYSGTVNESTRAFGGKVNIASGAIDNGSELASFSITEGENTTFVTVATGESIYQVEIDNQTGIGVVLDDRELNQYRHNEDGILPPPEGVS